MRNVFWIGFIGCLISLPAMPSVTESPDSLVGVICLPACMECYTHGTKIGLVATGATASCLTTPMTGFSAIGCVGGAAMVPLLTLQATGDCVACFCCHSNVGGFDIPACSGGGGSGNDSRPGPAGCPGGTHPGPTTHCSGHAPCCCDDQDPDICGVPA